MEILITAVVTGFVSYLTGFALGRQSDRSARDRADREREFAYIDEFTDLAADGHGAVLELMTLSRKHEESDEVRQRRTELDDVRRRLWKAAERAHHHLDPELAARCEEYARTVDHEMRIATEPWDPAIPTEDRERANHRVVHTMYKELRGELVRLAAGKRNERKAVDRARWRALLNRGSRPD